MKHGYSKIFNTENDKMTIEILHQIAKEYPDFPMYISTKEPHHSSMNGTLWFSTIYAVLDVSVNLSVNNSRKIIISNMIKRDYNIELDKLLYIPIDTTDVKVITSKELSSFIKNTGKNKDIKNDEISVVVYTVGGDDDDDVNYQTYTIDEICVDDETKNIMIKVF